jgi:hypothetical protein
LSGRAPVHRHGVTTLSVQKQASRASDADTLKISGPWFFFGTGHRIERTLVTAPARTWSRLLAALLAGTDLTAEDTAWAMRQVMDDFAGPAELAGFLVALRAKGESAGELRGLLDALMERVIRLPVDGAEVADIVGTGGDGAHTVNVSTMAAIVVAATGVPVVKHGGRSVSSKAGSADVLEALGLSLDLTPQAVARCVQEAGIAFTFAPRFHHGLRHAVPVRKALGVPTAINYLAPLTNPANPGSTLVVVPTAGSLPSSLPSSRTAVPEPWSSAATTASMRSPPPHPRASGPPDPTESAH